MAAVAQRTAPVLGEEHHLLARRYTDTVLLSITADGSLGAVYNAALTPPGPEDDGSGVSGVELDAVLGARPSDLNDVVGRRVAAAVLKPGESLTLCLQLRDPPTAERRAYVMALVAACVDLLQPAE